MDPDLVRAIGGAGTGGLARSPVRAVVVRIEEGSKVEANYRGKGKWYPGRVKQIRSDGSMDINYDDGESETRVEPDLVRLLGAQARSLSPPARKARIEEGSKVEANYRGKGKWFPGKVKRDRGDGTFDIDYDDGESETRVDEALIRLKESVRSSAERKPRIEEGSKVEANYRGKGKWYSGKVKQIRSDGTMDINYDDGESETRVEPDLVRLLGAPARSLSPPARKARIEEGSKVEANYRGKGKWFPGKVKRDRGDGTFDIDYDDGESETRVDEALIRLKESVRSSAERKPRIEEGSKVEANYRGKGKWYSGKVKQIRSDGTMDINYDDGESETRVEPDLVRLLGAPARSLSPPARKARIEEGSKVEANYRGKGKWFPGKVKRDRGDGTFDIDYDDGESETRVDEALIRLKESVRSSAERKPRIEEGSKVEANYRGKGKWYSGKVKQIRSDGTMDINYDAASPKHVSSLIWCVCSELRPAH